MNRIQVVVMVVAALALGGGGFVAGAAVGPSLAKAETSATPRAAGGQAGRGGAFASGAPGAAGAQGVLVQQVSGQVISVNDGSITVEVRQPGSDQTRSVIALVGGSSRVVRVTETQASLSDVKPGDQVLITGQPDQATGTVAANTIVLGVSSLQQIFGGGAAGPGASPGGFRRGPGPSPTPVP